MSARVRMHRGHALLFEKYSLTNLELIVSARLETVSPLLELPTPCSASLADDYHYTLILFMWALGIQSQVLIFCVVGALPTEPASSSSPFPVLGVFKMRVILFEYYTSRVEL